MAIKRGMGRIPSEHDLRNYDYLAVDKLPRSAAQITAKTHAVGPVFDQGDTQMCVVYSGIQYLQSGPILNKIDDVGFNWLYGQCQKVDEWPGESPTYEGTSVHALMKMFKRIGYVDAYLWSTSVQTSAQWILQKGPMVWGTIWTENMFNADKYGYVSVTGKVAGGHAYFVHGVNTTYKNPDGTIGRFLACNSWGTSFGIKGKFYITFKDAEKLVFEDGEMACGNEIIRLPFTPWVQPNWNG